MISSALNDIRSTFQSIHLVTTFAWQDIAMRYKRSRVGAFWLTVGMAVTIGALGIVFGSLFRQPMHEFLPFLTIGIILWTFFSSSLTEGGSSFITATDIILQVRMPLFLHVMRVLWRNIIILGHNILILPIVLLIFSRPVSVVSLLAIPGFILMMLNTGWIALMLAILCSRFRDIPQIVANSLQILYFITPIMWSEKILPERFGRIILDLNPCYHIINIVRAPLLGEFPSGWSWICSLGMAIIGWSLAIPLFGRYRNRIPYWL